MFTPKLSRRKQSSHKFVEAQSLAEGLDRLMKRRTDSNKSQNQASRSRLGDKARAAREGSPENGRALVFFDFSDVLSDRLLGSGTYGRELNPLALFLCPRHCAHCVDGYAGNG